MGEKRQAESRSVGVARREEKEGGEVSYQKPSPKTGHTVLEQVEAGERRSAVLNGDC